MYCVRIGLTDRCKATNVTQPQSHPAQQSPHTAPAGCTCTVSIVRTNLSLSGVRCVSAAQDLVAAAAAGEDEAADGAAAAAAAADGGDDVAAAAAAASGGGRAAKRKKLYDEHLGAAELTAGIKAGKYHQVGSRGCLPTLADAILLAAPGPSPPYTYPCFFDIHASHHPSRIATLALVTAHYPGIMRCPFTQHTAGGVAQDPPPPSSAPALDSPIIHTTNPGTLRVSIVTVASNSPACNT